MISELVLPLFFDGSKKLLQRQELLNGYIARTFTYYAWSEQFDQSNCD